MTVNLTYKNGAKFKQYLRITVMLLTTFMMELSNYYSVHNLLFFRVI